MARLNARVDRFGFFEAFRWLLLFAVAAWLLHPFATNRQLGSGDALWYANMLADFVLQLRHGFFPIFVGQTEFAFNGAVYPLRVAPLFQHLAGLIDMMTFRQLGWFTLQHLCVIAAGLAGIVGCYLALCALAPARRWSAAGLAILYLSCPGVLGTVFTFDLYMTWMTVPFVPLVFYGIVRSFQRDDIAAQIWMGASLAALWQAHSPIALWASILVGLTQIARLLVLHWRMISWRRAAVGGLLFAVLGHYPFVSVAALRERDAPSPALSNFEYPERIGANLESSFPSAILPVSPSASALGDLQLGYGLWVVFLAAAVMFAIKRSVLLGALLASALLLIVLVLPVPYFTGWIWLHFPQVIQRITYYWPMQRFYLILAGLLALTGQVGIAALSPRWSRFATALIFFGAAWSLWESRHFVHAASARVAPSADSVRAQRPENLVLMNHAYGLFTALPAYFSNGSMDPRSETRLLERGSLEVIESAKPTPILSGTLEGKLDENPGILKLSPSFTLHPGRRYELQFDFAQPFASGVLQVKGRDFFREYKLPDSGEALAFGAGENRNHALTLWSTATVGDEVTFRFIPSDPTVSPMTYAMFAHFVFSELQPEPNGVNVHSLAPLTVEAHSSNSAWLETPRMYMPGYRAAVDGVAVAVKRSPHLLAMVPIDAGSHQIEVRYIAPLILRISYWMTATAWLAVLAFGVLPILRKPSRFIRRNAAR